MFFPLTLILPRRDLGRFRIFFCRASTGPVEKFLPWKFPGNYSRGGLWVGWVGIERAKRGIGNNTRQIGHLFDPYQAKGEEKRGENREKRKKREGARWGILLKRWKLSGRDHRCGAALARRIKMKFTVTNVGRIGIYRVIYRTGRVPDLRSRANIADDMVSGMPEESHGTRCLFRQSGDDGIFPRCSEARTLT